MTSWLHRKLVLSAHASPSGMLEQFSLSRLIHWPTIVALLLCLVAYLYAAQHWLLMALQLWLGYIAGFLALSLLNQRSGARAHVSAAIATLVVGVSVGALVGSLIWFVAVGIGTFRWSFLMPHWAPAFAFGSITCGALMVKDFVRSERASADQAKQTLERQRQESAKQAAEAQLRLLQAQIEPHFLLNTLANVRSLIKRDADRARETLDHLSDYLHVALPRMRQTQSTLDREVLLSTSYLSIMQIRMGDRLSFRVHLDQNTTSLPFPPMLLQTLVENSVKHGIEPSAEPCEIVIEARVVMDSLGDHLQVSVTDTGVGFGRANTKGTGIGLINVRERLISLYGSGARLDISPNTPKGVVATLTIPAPSLRRAEREQ